MACFVHSVGLNRKTLTLLLGSGFLSFGIQAGHSQGNKLLDKVTVDGKYSNLLRKLYVPGDKDRYTNFCDWGRSRTTSYNGHENLPLGYWVYAAPHWYIWENKNLYKSRRLQRASVNGKYTDLLAQLPAVDDWRQYSKFKDAGFSKTSEYKSYKNLPPGYWVYVFPYWYIWGQKSQPLSGALLAASVGCKYAQLRLKIAVPSDEAYYGTFFDEGYWDGNTYAQFNNLPAGFWVYNHPHWYIWGELRNTKVKLQ